MDQKLPLLYSFRRCPYAMRARLALAYTARKVELREVVLKQKPPSLYTYSSKATVPVLVLPDGSVIDESLDIMLWALADKDPQQCLDNTQQQLALIRHNDSDFKLKLDRYKYADRHPELSEQAHRDNCYDFLDELEERLRVNKYLFASQLRLADMAIFPFIRQFAHVDLNWFKSSKWRAVQHWLDECKSSPLFTSIMNKYPAWQEGDLPTFFPTQLNDTEQ